MGGRLHAWRAGVGGSPAEFWESAEGLPPRVPPMTAQGGMCMSQKGPMWWWWGMEVPHICIPGFWEGGVCVVCAHGCVPAALSVWEAWVSCPLPLLSLGTHRWLWAEGAGL